MLTSVTKFKIKFNEVDALGIVWHGHYIRFFEDGREAFGEKHGLAYLDIYRQGYNAPVVNIHCDYKKSLQYRDTALIETTFVDNPAAKIIFQYKISLESTGEIIATGTSVQVFLDNATKQLQLITPDFFLKWKSRQSL
jgi:acyl-CoA thioester hydrolase